MAFHELYHRQVALLVRVIPLVADEPVFALKGGTAINLFVRNLPRLSVDIDLTYLPVQDRPASLAAINAAMQRIALEAKRILPVATVHTTVLEGAIVRLTVRSDGVQIKIEVTPVLRGCVYPPEIRSVVEAVENEYGFAQIQVVSFADLYAGKIVAALDRQHPRDLFDVRDLLANEGITDELRRAFIVYLLSHDRPMAEIVEPTRKQLQDEYARSFEGMTAAPVPLEELEAARETLIAEIVGNMPAAHRHFLLSFERGEPDWDMLGLPNVADLPAVRWRQLNLNKLPPKKRAALVEALAKALKTES